MRYLIVLLIAGCATTIDLSRSPPADWPVLRVEVRRAESMVLKYYCRSPDLVFVNGCTVPDFGAGVCRVFVSTDDQSVIAHEQMHCLGYDHPGESTMRDSWRRWKSL